MFRPLTLVAITAFSLVGWHVYQAEDAARAQEHELRELGRKIEAARERTLVLRAEWAMLNEPDRLRQVASAHLPLENMVPTQFLRMQDLEKRLPAPVAFAGPTSLFGTAPDANIAEAEPPAASPAQPTAPPVVTAAAARPAPRIIAAAEAAPVPRPAPRAASQAEAPRAEPRRIIALADPAPAAPSPARSRPAQPVLSEAHPRADGSLLRTASAHLPVGRAMAAPAPSSALGYAGNASGSVLAPPVPMGRPVPVAPGSWTR